MKAATVSPSRRLPSKLRAGAHKGGVNSGKVSPKTWTPPDFKKRLKEDFGGKIMPFSYVDFLER